MKRIRLANGLDVVEVPQPGARLAAVRLVLRVGSVDEAAAECGLAHVLEHLVVRCSMGGGRIGTGAVVTAVTGKEHTAYGAVVRPADLAAAVEMLGRAFRPLRVDHAALAGELATIAEERAQRAADPAWRLQQALLARMWRGTPYAHPVLGDPGVLARLTPDAVADFHARWYVPANAVLAVVADRPAAARVMELAAAWDAGRPPARRAWSPADAVVCVATERGEVGFALAGAADGRGRHLALACRAVREAAGLDVGRLVLGRHACVWMMATAREARRARGAVLPALTATLERLRASDGVAWLTSEAWLPELRRADDVEARAAAATDPGEAAEPGPVEVGPVEVGPVAGIIGTWVRSLREMGP